MNTPLRYDPFEETRRKIEKLFGYPKGTFDPWSPFLTDVERIGKLLGYPRGTYDPTSIFQRDSQRIKRALGKSLLEKFSHFWR